MAEDWLDRWENGRTGWHEAGGNAGLREYWQGNPGRVLVPLCGKSPDLVWLAERDHEVHGVELAEVAILEFFAEQGLTYRKDAGAVLDSYRCNEMPLNLHCGDYFEFDDGPFDAVYDRGSLVAIDPAMRRNYVGHTNSLLRPGAHRLLITLEYDQAIVAGPPFALMPDELVTYWDDLERVADKDDIDNCPPKFLKAGLSEIREVYWRSRG